jgi:hypothetical protein
MKNYTSQIKSVGTIIAELESCNRELTLAPSAENQKTIEGALVKAESLYWELLDLSRGVDFVDPPAAAAAADWADPSTPLRDFVAAVLDGMVFTQAPDGEEVKVTLDHQRVWGATCSWSFEAVEWSFEAEDWVEDRLCDFIEARVNNVVATSSGFEIEGRTFTVRD